MERGYSKIYRKILDWQWYKNSNVKNLFIHCVLKANHSEKKWEGEIIKAGEFITSLAKLSEEIGISVQQIRSALNKLNNKEIVVKSTNKYTKITLLNHNIYNNNKEGKQQTNNKQPTNNQQTTNKQITTTKNNKEQLSIIKHNKTNTDLLKQVVDYLNTKLNTKYQTQSKKTQDLINARFKEGFLFDDFKYVIDIKYKEWSSDPNFHKFLRPETLFSNKFEGYRNQKEKAEAKKINWLEDYAIEEDKNDK